MLFGQRREQIRRVFVDAWRKHCDGVPLEPLERSIAEIVDAHPEYQAAMMESDVLERDFSVDDGETNPFLHMGMHITIVEQITCDRPPGIRDIYNRLLSRYPDSHELEHAMMQCLAETLWSSRSRGEPPDEQKYLRCVRRLNQRVL